MQVRPRQHRFAGLIFAACAAWSATVAAGAELNLRILDDATGEPLPARVRIRNASGNDQVPEGQFSVPIGPVDRWFASSGTLKMSVPPGPVEIRVEHGTEYSPHKAIVTAPEQGGLEHEVRLRRWIHMRERGFVCGDNHLHVAAGELGPQLAAEGLDFGTSLHWWNGPKFEPPPGDGFIRVLRFAGRSIPTSVYDFEIERAWGAVYAVGVPEQVKQEARSKRPNLPMVRAAHEAGALIAYQAGYSREALLDALLGHVDVINVISNNFLRHRFQPRSRYSNLLGVEGFPTYPDTVEGMVRLSLESYYRLLNCGLRLAAGAESATGAKNTPVGYNRAYVRAGQEARLPDFLAAWRAGRNFVTNGPVLFLKVNRQEPGAVIDLDRTGVEVGIEAEAIADQPLTGLEIVVNGRQMPLRPVLEGRRATLSTSLTVREGCWIAARCFERDDLLTDAELAAYDHAPEAKPTRLRWAHTSPVYVTMNGRGPRVERSLDEARRMLAAFEAFALREAAPAYRDDIAASIQRARGRLQSPQTTQAP